MKKILAAFGVTVVLVGIAAPAYALSVSDIQAQIQELLARVAALTAQMNQMTSPGVGVVAITNPMSAAYPHRICALLNRNLSQGMSGDDVRGMQEFLQSEGYLQATPTGYFGPMTGQAIVKWQAKEGIAQVGAFGPLSRERLKLWCGGLPHGERFVATPTRGEAPLTVVFETWLSGFRMASTYFTIDFGDGTSERAADCYAPADACLTAGQNKHTYASNGTYTAVLNKVIDPCAGNQMCKAAVQITPVAKQQIAVGAVACTKEYAPVCASKQVYCITTPCNPVQQTYSNRCMATADGATVLYDGQCRTDGKNPADDPQCKSWYDGCNSCSRSIVGGVAMCTLRACMLGSETKAYCTGYFDSGNKPPTISSFSGPTTLNTNQTGTWTIKASDPEGGSLYYQVDWGYPVVAAPASSSGDMMSGFTQVTTFEHTYSSPGTYTITVIARDDKFAVTKTSSTVRVTGEVVACTMQYNPVCATPYYCLISKFASGSYPAECQYGKTYSNRCSADAEKASFKYQGVCQTEPVACTMEYAPVCGSPATSLCADATYYTANSWCWAAGQAPAKQTYSNRCALNAAKAAFLYEGQCESSGSVCTADAYQCPNGQWVRRTGTQCQFICPTSGSGADMTSGTNSCTYAGASYQHDELNTTGSGGMWLPQRCCNGAWRSSLGNLVGAPVCSSTLWPQNQ